MCELGDQGSNLTEPNNRLAFIGNGNQSDNTFRFELNPG